ncbi:putative transcription factor C2H2 family [Medicago truncatula]|uniref:Putative transcription factor C2H2 family n=1 Tax=Medicago truncatula TaxID=3880 RepID=A0A396GPD6_MEDTR|nr:putative transcription factor C2H2 family [Medicago truncatula]
MDFIGESCNSAYSDGDHEPPNKKLKRFNVWNYFVKIEADGKELCECKTCGKQFISGRTGISHLNQVQHITKCPLIMKSRIAKHFKLNKIDHRMVRDSVTQMTIKSYIPFQFAEWDEFRAFTKFASFNEARSLSRDNVVADVMKVYLLEKDKLKKQLAAVKGGVCLSFHCWTSSTSSHGYVTLTAHFMDDQWNLVVKVLSFCHFNPSHDSFELSRKVIDCLQEWGIERNVFSITMDNVSANDETSQNLKNQLCSLDSLLRTFITSATAPSLEKHFKCCARVLDLMVEREFKGSKWCIGQDKEQFEVCECVKL